MQIKRNAKRLYLINREFQFKYILGLGLVSLLTTLLTFAVILYPLHYFGIIRYPLFLPPMIFVMMGFTAVINIVIICFSGLYITHRIAGPMFALTRMFRLVGLGQWNQNLQVRKDDELKYVVRGFNQMLEALVQQGRIMTEMLEEIKADDAVKDKLKQYLASRIEIQATNGTTSEGRE